MKEMRGDRMKKVIAVIAAMVLAVSLTACGGAKEISEKKYQQLMSDMGIKGVESVADNVIVDAVYHSKIDSKEYQPQHVGDKEYFSIYKELSEICGEQKDYSQYGCYALGEDQEQALAIRENYKSHLLEQGYEYQRTDNTYGDIYIKGSYAVMVQDIVGPVNWSDESKGQYGLFVWFY